MKLISSLDVCRGFLPARVALALLCATGVMAVYMARINLSIAIVAMVHVPSTKNVTKGTMCIQDHDIMASFNRTVKGMNASVEVESAKSFQTSDKIIMTSTEKGSILGSFFYGYVTTGIIGGRLAEVYGTKRVYGLSMLMGGVLSLLTPIAAQTHYILFTAVRLLLGIVQGVVFPSLHCLMSRWIPPLERPRFMSFVYIANCLGIVISMPVFGLIIDAAGWPWVFYTTGIVTLVWVVLWAMLMQDIPHQHSRITQAELKYITDAINQQSKDGAKPTSVPWMDILRCRGLWAIAICHAGNMYGFNLLNTQLPSYMDGVLGLSIKKNALFSSIPFLTRFMGSQCWSWIGDTLNTKEILSIRVTRRLFSAIGLLGMAVVLSIVGSMGCNVNLIVFLLALGMFCAGSTTTGYGSNHLDMAPNFAGTMFGMSNTFAFLVAMLAPVLVGALTPDQTPKQWQAAFLSTAAILVLSVIVYLFMADTEMKPWNFAAPNSSKEMDQGDAATKVNEGFQADDEDPKTKGEIEQSEAASRANEGFELSEEAPNTNKDLEENDATARENQKAEYIQKGK